MNHRVSAQNTGKLHIPTLPHSIILVLKRKSMSMMLVLFGLAVVLFVIGYLIRIFITLGKTTTWLISGPLKIKRYFKENPRTVYIGAFQVLLLMCAGLLIQGNSVLAEGVAIVAYFLLVVVVFWQLIFFVRHGKEEESKDDEE